jgi:GntR family transcriptional regulator
MPPMFEINTHSPIPVYEQLTFSVKAAISSGMVKAGDQLPSIREVAEVANVNPNTVAKAFRDLELQGFTAARRGMGIFITAGAFEKARIECKSEVQTLIRLAHQQALAAGLDWNALTRFI